MNLLEFLSHLFVSVHESIPRVPDGREAIEREMDEIPVDASGKPDLCYFTKPLEHYIQVYEGAWKDHESAGKLRWSGEPDDPNLATIKKLVDIKFRKRVHATWGLIAKGSDAIPYALTMLNSAISDIREDGAGILGAVGREEGVVEALLQSLDTETDVTARDSVILALGELRNRKAIPLLAKFIRNPETDGDTQWGAMLSLGRIVRKRFEKKPDPLAAALEWLTKHRF
jgi:hypothetical protein